VVPWDAKEDIRREVRRELDCVEDEEDDYGEWGDAWNED
jgi:hypothetical protein